MCEEVRAITRGTGANVVLMVRHRSLFWRVFAVNAGLLGAIALLLLFSPVEIDAPIKPTQALIVVGGLVITVMANALLLRRVVVPLERLAQRMETVDLLRPGQRLPVGRHCTALGHKHRS